MMLGIANFFRGVWVFIGKIFAGIGKWLREDHDWWMITCFGLGFAFMCAAFLAYDAKQTVVLVELAAANERQTHVLVVKDLARTISEKDRALLQIQKNLLAEAAKLRALMLANEGLREEVKAKTTAADKNYAAYLRESAKKPASCTAALKVLQQACPTLGSY